MKSKIDNRLIVALGSIIAQIGLGTIYTWSLFNQPIADKFGFGLSSVAATFSITSFSLAFSTLFAGKLQEKLGIRKMTTIAGIFLGIGLILTSKINSLSMLYITAGIIVGAADGISYISILSNCIKWFPEKRGLISGISVGAYGIGSLVFKYINGYLINTQGVSATFLYWGIMAMIFVVVGSQFIKDAPIVETKSKTSTKDSEFTIGEMLKTKEVYLLFIVFFTACMSGLYLIGIVKDLGVQLAGLTVQVAANAVAMVAIFNTIGRIILGILSDKIGRLRVMLIALIVIGISASVLSFIPMNMTIFFICVSAIAFCFGGSITIFPPIVGEFFGINHQTSNYGIVYQGFGLGALSGTIIASLVGGFKPTFVVVTILCLISILIVSTIKIPVKQSKRKVLKERAAL